MDKVIKLRKGRFGVLRPGHPWIFRRQFLKPAQSISPADIVSVMNSENRFVGRGYYNPKSEISVRLLTSSDEPIDKIFFVNRIKSAAEKRKHLLAGTNAYRAVFSEADSLPGLIVDIYRDTAVFQILTLGMERFKSTIVEAIKDALQPKYIYEKSSSPFRKLEGMKDATGWRGEPGENPIEIFEGKVKFLVDIERGHKTGFYLDQRKSRLALEAIAGPRRVLDLFCYTGAFAVTAAVYGAEYCRGVEIKEEWLAAARKNAELNGAAEKTEFVRADAFSALKEIHDSGERFDIIILDPPSFLKKRESLASASKGYKELNLLAIGALGEGGILATFSCSRNMPNEKFAAILKEAAAEAGREFAILKRCHQAEDHPIVKAIPETEYLKGYFLRVK